MVSLFIHVALCCSCCRRRDDEEIPGKDIDEVRREVSLEEARPAVIEVTRDVPTSPSPTDDGIKDTTEKDVQESSTPPITGTPTDDEIKETTEKDVQESSTPPITGTPSKEEIEQRARKIISRMFDTLSKENENGT